MGTIKTAREIGFLRKAAAISNSCIPIISRALREEKITEREIARRIMKNIYRRGGRLSFRTLVASGRRSAMIHPRPTVTDEKVSGIGYVDFGASYRGYKTDVTVPFVKGKIGPRERKAVKAVLQAYRLALRSWKVGMPCWKLFDVADGHIRSRRLRMGHSLGHGVGLRIHEMPTLGRPRKKLAGKKLKKWERIKRITFQPGMVFTIEPGAYVKGVGGSRIENTFLASGKKLKALTKSKLIKA